MKHCSRLLIAFCRNLCEKRQIWVSEPHFAEARGDARPWLMAHWKMESPWSTFYSSWLNLLLSIIQFRSYEAKCVCKARLFLQGGRPFYAQILPGQGHLPSTALGVRKPETLGYPMVKTHPSAFPRFNTVSEYDGRTNRQTDGQICRSIYSVCKARFAERCKNDRP